MELLFLTVSKDFFGQTRKPWVSMDVKAIISNLEKEGFVVTHKLFSEISESIDTIKGKLIFYGFSQKEEIRGYIIDIISILDKNNTVIPSIDFLRCHENKGYQELYKKSIGFKSLDAQYITSLEEIDRKKFSFPFVFKTLDGSNGNGVFLIKNEEELQKIYNSLNKIPLLEKLDYFRRKYLRKKKFYSDYPNYTNEKDLEEYTIHRFPSKRFIVQQFVDELTFDYRVLVLNRKFFIMKRHVKTGDFRASGSKKFDFDFQVPQSILNYANEIFHKFDTPFFSIDLASKDDKNFFLIEYQALHFGASVYTKNDRFYTKSTDSWEVHKINGTPIEEVIAQEFSSFVKSKK